MNPRDWLWETSPRNDLFCVEWDVKPRLGRAVGVCNDRAGELQRVAGGAAGQLPVGSVAAPCARHQRGLSVLEHVHRLASRDGAAPLPAARHRRRRCRRHMMNTAAQHA